MLYVCVCVCVCVCVHVSVVCCLHRVASTTNITLAHYANSLITCESSHHTKVLLGNNYGCELHVEQLCASDRQ